MGYPLCELVVLIHPLVFVANESISNSVAFDINVIGYKQYRMPYTKQ